MNFFIDIFRVVVYLFFFFLLYKVMNLKNKYIFSFSILVSYIVCLYYCKNVYFLILLNVPVFLLISNNYKKSFIFISLIGLLYNQVLFLEYIFIFLLFFYKKNKTNIFVFISIYFYSIIIFYYDVNAIYYLFSIVLFSLCLFFLNYYYFIDIEKELEDKYSTYLFKFIHEVKNPLSVVLGYIEIINKKDAFSSKYMMIIEKEVRESLNIIEDYLMYGRFNVIFDYVDINLLLKDVYDDFKKLENVYDMNINFYYDEEEVFVLGDYSKLKQVIVNIIKNSLEAKKDKKLIIDIDYKISKDKVIIDINDNGVGINNLSLVGQKFYSTKSNGTGLGVNFSKKIIDLHKGEIKYISSENTGTDVRINLPIINI